MAPLPSASDFASFQELQCSSASEAQNCIWYLPNDKRRCRHRLNKVDRNEAFRLRTAILRSLPHEISLEHLTEYARLKCCNYGHRSELTEHDLTESLARKWQQELSSISNSQHTAFRSSPSVASEPSVDHQSEPYSQTAPGFPQTRLRSRQGTQTQGIATCPSSTDLASPPFRPYKKSRPQSVSSKLITPLTPQSKSGSIYLYTRASSPGYVKIGYSCNVQSRLKDWQRSCGYKPILLAAFDDVPHMQRVESLIHHQLADVWRAEKWCERCCHEHREWFEIAKEDAIRVAGQWAQWMKRAQPYGVRGYLRGFWVDELERIETRGIAVTAEALLSAHGRVLESAPGPSEGMEEADNITRGATHSTMFAADSMAEPNADLHRMHDLANFVVAMLGIMKNLDGSFQRAAQAVMAADSFRRARTAQAYTMAPGSTRPERQETGSAVASEA